MKRSKLLAMAVLTTVASVGFVVSANAQEKAVQKAAETPAYTLGEIVVESERETMAGGFLKNEGHVGILGKKDIMEIPFSVTAIGAKTIENFASPQNGITDALSFAPGVRTEKGGLYTEFSIRGFNESGYGVYLNGIPGMLAMESTASAHIESATVVSGPNIGVNGTNGNESVGGTVNYKTKVAQDDPVNTVKIGYRGGASFEEAIDYGKRFGKNNEWGIRINANNVNGNTSVDDNRVDKRGFYANIDHKDDNSKTNLLLGYNYTRDRGTTSAFKIDGSYTGTAMPSAPDASRAYKPDWVKQEYENYIVTLNHEQKLGKHIGAFVNAGYHDQKWFRFIDTYDGTNGLSILNPQGDYSSEIATSQMHNKTTYIGVGLKGDFKVGSVNNDYVISVDRIKRSSNLGDTYGPGGSSSPAQLTGNLYSGKSTAPYYDEYVDADKHPWYDQTLTGWHVVDTMKFMEDKLQLTVGVHGHKSSKDTYFWGGAKPEVSGVSPTYAVSYKFSPDVVAFANHTENFQFGSTMKLNTKQVVLDPVKVKQNEIGVKFKSGNFVNTVSLFDIKKPVASKSSDGNSVVYNDVEHKGIEWGFTGKIADKVDLLGAMMYLDAKQDNGIKANGTPKWSASVGTIYHFDDAWSAKMRASYVGSCTINNEKYEIPSHAVFDLGATYKTKHGTTPVSYDLMVYNLFGKDYWSGVAGSNAFYLGSPRTITLSATFQI